VGLSFVGNVTQLTWDCGQRGATDLGPTSKKVSIILACATAVTGSFFLLTINRGLKSWLIVNIGDYVLVIVIIVVLQRVIHAESLVNQHPVGIVILLSDSYPQSDSTGHSGELNNAQSDST
jgi:hypothetical protein